MTPIRSAGELMAVDYGSAPAGDAPGRSDLPLVAVDDEGRPRWVVGPAGPAPAVVMSPDDDVTALAAMPGVLRLLNDGLPAVLVVDGDRLVGVLRPAAIRAELARMLDADGDAVGTVLDADWELYGPPNQPVHAIRIKCARCGTVSALPEYPTPDGLCPAGQDHALVPDWEG
ncbi:MULTISPECIES: hypothetical protein [unclassified Nonomuraea]|uniref:hypothetical protein n=1 Tax=unclassified Nonomuraea TaxID=2593643 RepID=UPI0035C105AE